jgi:uncharacterized protein with HEPN domain
LERKILDILQAINEITQFVNSMQYSEFINDVKTLRAVELNLIIIGEAVAAIPEEIQEKYSSIPWHLMRGMRNQLVRMYFRVSPKILWDTIQNDLPIVSSELKNFLEN